MDLRVKEDYTKMLLMMHETNLCFVIGNGEGKANDEATK